MYAHRFLPIALTLAAPAVCQSAFTNFETPQTHPIEVITIGTREFVLVCNTPDNSLEIWTASSGPVKIARVPVGLGPGSVRWNASLQRAFVCNFDGDSVSSVSVVPSGGSVTAQLERTTWVGDEPADIAFSPNTPWAMVTLSAQGKVAVIDSTTLAGFQAPLNVDFANSNGQYANIPFPFAVKEPRAIAWLPSDRLFVLNLKGSENVGGTTQPYDVDLLRTDTPFVPSGANYIGQLGTTNHAMAITANGDKMFVVGTKAQNNTLAGATVATAATGFVQSWMSVVDLPTTGNLTVHAEAPTGGIPPALPSINLNRDYATAGLAEISPTLGISQPTDIDLFESAGRIKLIALTGYHSDNVGLLTPASVVGGYTIQRVALSPMPGYSVVGPRGLAFNAAGDLLFVHGRLDNSLRVIKVASGAVSSTPMQDPTPTVIRMGRQFLYSTRFSNTPALQNIGFVSCASCHVDGRTDALAWDLSHTNFIPVPAHLNDGPDGAGGFIIGFPYSSFPNPKGTMITQTLQGLVDWPLNEDFQFLATNAPYHWRGDKPDFTNFNEAFVNLQRMANQPGAGTGEQAKGLTDADMLAYRRFVFTIRHPSNPEEQLNRRPSGTLPTNPNVVPTVAGGFSGAMMGRALFHNFPMVGDGRSCVDCHNLPEGSSNTLVLSVANPLLQAQPLESAAMRNIRSREAQRHSVHQVSSFTVPDPNFPLVLLPQWDTAGTTLIANRGVTHEGLGFLSVDMFLGNFFFNAMPSAPFQTGSAATLGLGQDQIEAMAAFNHQLDTGIAPLVGIPFTADPANPTGNNQALFALETEANEANIGLGVIGRTSSGLQGFWYDPTVNAYRDASLGLGATVTRATLLATFAVAGNLLVAQGTPLGSERRWANPNGVAVAISGPAPTGVQLEPMVPDTFFDGIADLNLNLNHASAGMVGTTRWRINTLQGLLVTAGFVPAARHEPPRRFRVSGQNIRPGAKLFVQVPDGTGPGNFFGILMEMDLFPTGHTTAGGNPIWETETELDQLKTYAMLCGGPLDPAVQSIHFQTMSTSPYVGPLPTPSTANQYRMLVVNEDLTTSSLTPPIVSLQIQTGR